MAKLHPGDAAPEFELPDQNGRTVRLSDFRRSQSVVLFFYPKDDTTGCTREVCGFRDEMERFHSAGAAVIGVSSDSPQSHAAFAAKYDLSYTLLSDAGGAVRRLYGVRSTFGVIPGRATYVIDRDGIVRLIFSNQFQPERHVQEALSLLSKTSATGQRAD